MKNINTIFHFILMIIICVALLPTHVQAQEDAIAQEQEYLFIYKRKWVNNKYDREVKDFRGTVHKETRDSVWIMVLGESQGYKKSQIISMEPWYYKGKHKRPDRNMHRHLFSPTAVNIKKGEGYYQNVLLGGQLFTYGLQDYFSLSVGVEAFSFFYWEELICFIHPKFSFEISENVRLGAGVLAGAYFWEFTDDLEQVIAVGYSNLTFGNDDANFTLGYGYGRNWDYRIEKISSVMSGANIRMSNTLTFATETALIRTQRIDRDRVDAYFVSINGLKFNFRKNTIDLGFMIAGERDEIYGVAPYIGYLRYI